MKIAELKEKITMEELLAHYGVAPGTNGWNHWMPIRCPFHDDHQASASVNEMENRFNCHGCGVKGDIVDIVQQVENDGDGDVADAMEWLEETFL